MKKQYFVGVIMAALLAMGSLAGCTTQESTADQTDKAEQTEQTTQTEPVALTVSAAASLTDVMEELAAQYETEHPEVDISFTFGGSGALQAQIEEGAPVDLFFSAAESNMDALEEQGLIDSTTRKDMLQNEIVLIAPAGETKVTGFAEILDSNPRIALGEAESVPAGKYAMQIFENLGIWDEVQKQAVFASNVREVLAWVETGEVDCGVVYATDAKTSDKIQVICSAPEDAPQVLYPAAVVQSSANPEQAQAFLDYLCSEEAKEAFTSYGFTCIAQ